MTPTQRSATELLGDITVFVLAELPPEFTAEADETRRQAARAVWRRHRDEALDALDQLERVL